MLGSGKSKNVSSLRRPLAICSQWVPIWHRTDPHEKWKSVAWPLLFCFYIGLGLSPLIGADLVSSINRFPPINWAWLPGGWLGKAIPIVPKSLTDGTSGKN